MPCCMSCDHSRAEPFSAAAAAIIESVNREPVALGEFEAELVRADRDRRDVEQAADQRDELARLALAHLSLRRMTLAASFKT